MNNSGTPWWGTLLIALSGALVGGLITLRAGSVNGRRELTYRRLDSLRGVVVEFLADADDAKKRLATVGEDYEKFRNAVETIRQNQRDMNRAVFEMNILAPKNSKLKQAVGDCIVAIKELVQVTVRSFPLKDGTHTYVSNETAIVAANEKFAAAHKTVSTETTSLTQIKPSDVRRYL